MRNMEDVRNVAFASSYISLVTASRRVLAQSQRVTEETALRARNRRPKTQQGLGLLDDRTE